jgi:hypothetical protein
MNPELIYQLANQRRAELCREVRNCESAAADRTPHWSAREWAGWALINVGLRLTGPPSHRLRAQPWPSGR